MEGLSVFGTGGASQAARAANESMNTEPLIAEALLLHVRVAKMRVFSKLNQYLFQVLHM